jgi:TIR domain
MANLFPNSMDYISAVENARNFVLDPALKHGRPRFGKDGQLLLYSGEFAKVFVIDCSDENNPYALRCWTRDIGEAPRRYAAVSKYLARKHLSYFTEFAYVSEGILVNGVTYPILRMEWVEAPSLSEFIGRYRHQPQVLMAAGEKFLAMAETLHKLEIAHGDLQNDNVKVRMSEPEFLLIDYDTLFVPDLADTKVTNLGAPAFQHPMRRPVATKKDDYFAELVIYHTICAVAEDPKLWDDYGMAEREKELIFSPEDFQSAAPSERFRRLRNLSPLVSKLTLLLWNYTRCGDTQWLIPLEEAVKICRASSVLRPTKSFEKMSKPKPEEWLTEWPGFRFDDMMRSGRDATPITPLLDENVQFTVYRPREITPMRWYKMLIFTHLDERPEWLDASEPSPIEGVEDEAQRMLGPRLETYRKTTEESRLAIPREGEIILVPQMRGIEFNPPTRSFSWKDGLCLHLETFELRAGPDFHAPTVVRGRVTIFLRHLILAEVALSIQVSQRQNSGTLARAPSESSSARRFRRIFASYSHKDLEIVKEMERYSLSLGDRYLRDWVDLRAGERWNERLLGMISEADIFQLFWSWNSSQSPYVEREWRHALSLRRETFIRPTYWEDPCPDPPEPLRPIQFHRLETPRPSASDDQNDKPDTFSSPPLIFERPLRKFDDSVRGLQEAPGGPPPKPSGRKFDELLQELLARPETEPPLPEPMPPPVEVAQPSTSGAARSWRVIKWLAIILLILLLLVWLLRPH